MHLFQFKSNIKQRQRDKQTDRQT